MLGLMFVGFAGGVFNVFRISNEARRLRPATRIRGSSVAAGGKIDPMHQFVIEPIFGSFQPGNPFVFTNSALWTLIVLARSRRSCSAG